MRIRIRATACAIAVVTSAVLLAGCSGGSSGSAAASGGAESETLRVTTASTDLGALPLFIAQARGLFAKQNLTVDINNASATTITALLSSGGTDLVQNSNGVAISHTLKGQPTVVAYGQAAYNSRTELWSGSVSSLQDAAALPECRLATVAPGGATYGHATYWKERFGLKCEIVVAQSYDVIVAGLTAGSYTLGVIPRSTVGTVPDSMKILIKQDTPDYPGFPGGKGVVTAGLLGLKSNLESKREAMVRFERAMIEAQQIVDSSDPEALVGDVQQNQIFKAVPADTLRSQIVAGRGNIWKDPETGKPGFISESVWKNSLNTYSYWGIQGFTPDDPAVAYTNMVDMSYLAAAEKPA